MRCLYFGFYLTLYELISPAVPFLFFFVCFVLFSVTFGSTLLGVAENLFPGGTLFACYLYLLFCSANRSYTSYSSCGKKKKERMDTQPLCLSWHIGMWVSPLVACSISSVCRSLALQQSFFFSADRAPLLRAILLTLLPPPHSTQPRQNLSPRPTFHSLL